MHEKNISFIDASPAFEIGIANLFAAFSPHLPVPYIFGTRGLVGLIYWQLGAIGSKYIGNWKIRAVPISMIFSFEQLQLGLYMYPVGTTDC